MYKNASAQCVALARALSLSHSLLPSLSLSFSVFNMQQHWRFKICLTVSYYFARNVRKKVKVLRIILHKLFPYFLTLKIAPRVLGSRWYHPKNRGSLFLCCHWCVYPRFLSLNVCFQSEAANHEINCWSKYKTRVSTWRFCFSLFAQ